MPIEIELLPEAIEKVTTQRNFKAIANKILGMENIIGIHKDGYSFNLMVFASFYYFVDLNKDILMKDRYNRKLFEFMIYYKLIQHSKSGAKYANEVCEYYMKKLFGQTIAEAEANPTISLL